MFKRPAWATTSGNGTSSPYTAAGASSSFTLPGAASPGNDAQILEQRPSTSDSLFRHAARTHDAVVAGLAARRKKETSSGKKDQRSRVSRSSGEKRKSITDHDANGVVEDDADEQEASNTPIKDETAKQKTTWTPTTLKKRRIGADDVKALLSRAGFDPVADSDDGEDEEIEGVQLHARDESHAKNEPIIIEDDDQDDQDEGEEEDLIQIQDHRPSAQSPFPPEEDDESDPELLELRRKARERHKQAEGRSATPLAGVTNASTTSPTHDMDPVVHILITSPMPNTNPLIVQRKLSQRLQEVRQAWCQRQTFTDDVAAQVYLTFRGRRKYDVTAVKSLGLEVDALGTVTMRNGDFVEEVNRVHLEAVTDEIQAKQKNDKEKPVQQETEGAIVGVAAHRGPPEQQQQLIRLLIKAKGQSDFKLKVKPDTVISKIVHAARREFRVSNHGVAYLEFDGERLNPQDQVKDTEIEDMMCLDFYSS